MKTLMAFDLQAQGVVPGFDIAAEDAFSVLLTWIAGIRWRGSGIEAILSCQAVRPHGLGSGRHFTSTPLPILALIDFWNGSAWFRYWSMNRSNSAIPERGTYTMS